MSNDITAQNNSSFQDKLCERLRADIGDLLPDEVLRKLVEESIQKIFFTKQQGRYGQLENSWFEKEVESLMQPLLRSKIDAYMRENEDVLVKQLADTIAETAPTIMASYIVATLQGQGYNAANTFQNMIMKLLEGKMS